MNIDEDSAERCERIVGILVDTFDVLTENLTDDETLVVAADMAFQLDVIQEALSGGT